jgi:hypothetical protein
VAPVFVPALDKLQDLSGSRYQPIEPGSPLKGPTTQLVIQPPQKPPGCGTTCSPLMVQRSTCAGMTVGHRFFLCVNESGLA